jgi:prepilin-type processing-associated H-X9-DG protein
MAIISALAAMLVPAVSRARGQALCAVCQSNLHQVGIALARHTLDYGHYPQFGLQSTDNPWGKQIGEYLGYVKAVNVCPAFPEARRKTPEGQVVIVTYSYGWNAWGSGIGGDFGLDLGAPIFAARKGLSDMEVVTPHDMIAFGDSEPNSFFGGILIPTFGLDMGGFIESFGPSRRHLEGANMVFCDGHVEYGKNPDWVAHQDPVMRRWNRDHQPHPETWDMDLTQF